MSATTGQDEPPTVAEVLRANYDRLVRDGTISQNDTVTEEKIKVARMISWLHSDLIESFVIDADDHTPTLDVRMPNGSVYQGRYGVLKLSYRLCLQQLADTERVFLSFFL